LPLELRELVGEVSRVDDETLFGEEATREDRRAGAGDGGVEDVDESRSQPCERPHEPRRAPCPSGLPVEVPDVVARPQRFEEAAGARAETALGAPVDDDGDGHAPGLGSRVLGDHAATAR
jgi:hypothetical protein